MQFLDRFDGATRERLMAAGRVMRLDPGDLLIKRGARGGDIYFVEEGSFEVVDTRSSPEVVLAVVGTGAVLGEVSFVDAAPRTADVRATGLARVRVWEYEGLQRVLDQEPILARAFYRALAETSVERLRALSTNAIAGGLGPRASALVAGDVGEQARNIASRVQARWLEADVRLRRDPDDPQGQQEGRAGFTLLLQQASAWLRSFSDTDAASLAGAALGRELRPYLIRSELAQLCLDPPAGRTGHPQQLAHVLLNQPRGDDALGGVLDACLLALPTPQGLRERVEVATAGVPGVLPEQRSSRIMLVNATGAAMLTGLVADLARLGSEALVIDGSREALAFVDAGLPSRPSSVRLKLVQQDLGALVLGTHDAWYDPQDVVVIDALVDYLPDRLVATLLGWVAQHLDTGGAAILTGLAPSPDALLFDHVLRWPMVRRSARELAGLVEAAGLHPERLRGPGGRAVGSPSLVLLARRNRNGQVKV